MYGGLGNGHNGIPGRVVLPYCIRTGVASTHNVYNIFMCFPHFFVFLTWSPRLYTSPRFVDRLGSVPAVRVEAVLRWVSRVVGSERPVLHSVHAVKLQILPTDNTTGSEITTAVFMFDGHRRGVWPDSLHVSGLMEVFYFSTQSADNVDVPKVPKMMIHQSLPPPAPGLNRIPGNPICGCFPTHSLVGNRPPSSFPIHPCPPCYF